MNAKDVGVGFSTGTHSHGTVHGVSKTSHLCEFGKWVLLSGILGVLIGSASALFLAALDQVTTLRFEHPELLWLLPLAGFAIGWLSLRVGPAINSGNNLLIHEIKHPQHGVPIMMAPFVFCGTLLTHLCGGSAGREGTAVQMGGSIAGGLARLIPGLSEREVRLLLMAGVAAGFGGVFGTPLAGMVFALEVAVLGRIETRAIHPCLVAAIISDQVCTAWGIEHTSYGVQSLISEGSMLRLTPLSGRLILSCMAGGVIFGLAARLFAGITHAVQGLCDRYLSPPLLRPVVGGCVVIALVSLAGNRDSLGLGVSSPDPAAATIVNAFHVGGVHPWSWWWKLLFTAVTLGSGYKGGEATPLFFIGAALGHVLASWFGVPVDFLAAMGFVAVFAGATHTPLACTVMAAELFGVESIFYFGLSCLIANQFSGLGVYTAQGADSSVAIELYPLSVADSGLSNSSR